VGLILKCPTFSRKCPTFSSNDLNLTNLEKVGLFKKKSTFFRKCPTFSTKTAYPVLSLNSPYHWPGLPAIDGVLVVDGDPAVADFYAVSGVNVNALSMLLLASIKL
jgi:hypothetical protein